jgi:hypothetical protein
LLLRLGQEDSLYLRTWAHAHRSGDLPEDILRLYAAQESHFGPRGLSKARRCLDDEDVVFIALEGDIALKWIGALNCLRDRSHLKVARCLRQDTAVEVGACH